MTTNRRCFDVFILGLATFVINLAVLHNVTTNFIVVFNYVSFLLALVAAKSNSI